MEIESTNVLGVRISVIDQDRARKILFDAVRSGRRGYVTVTGVYGVMEAQDDENFRAILNSALWIAKVPAQFPVRSSSSTLLIAEQARFVRTSCK